MRKRFLRRLAAISSLTVIAVPGLAACGPSDTDAGGDTYTIRLATSTPPEHPSGAAAEAFKEQVEADSNGRIKVSLFYGGQLGSIESVQDQLRQGSVQALYANWTYAEKYDQSLAVLDLPFLFSGFDEAFAVLDGDVGEQLSQILTDKSGIRVLGFGTTGFSQLFSKDQLTSVGDFEGYPLRVAPSEINIATMEALGFGVRTVDAAEIRTALQQGVIKSLFVSTQYAESIKLAEVAGYVLPWNIQMATMALEMNNDFYESLPADLQTVVDDAAKAATDLFRQLVVDGSTASLAALESSGMTNVPVTTELAAEMRSRVAPVWQDFQEKNPGAAPLLDAITTATGSDLR
jgi:TRAP-type C4-dicarboxylate transport system substrate-binding protein